MNESHLPIERMDVYVRITNVSDAVWEMVTQWPLFAKDTLGKQLVRAVDSIAANLVEADGRYGDGDGLHFLVIARASAREAIHWVNRAAKRDLIDGNARGDLLESLDHSARSINNLISYRRQRSIAGKVKETRCEYSTFGISEHRTPNTEHLVGCSPNQGVGKRE